MNDAKTLTFLNRSITHKAQNDSAELPWKLDPRRAEIMIKGASLQNSETKGVLT